MTVDEYLQSVVDRIRLRLQGGDGIVPLVGPVEVRIAAASHRELVSGGAGRRNSVHRAAAAIGLGHALARRIWILGRANGVQLIDVALQREMRAFAADVRDGHYGSVQELALDVDIPLLHVRPDRLSWNRGDAQRE